MVREANARSTRSTKSVFTSSRTISIRSLWNRNRRLLTSEVTHRPPSSSNANPSRKESVAHGEDGFSGAEYSRRSNRKAPHPSSKRLHDIQPLPGWIRSNFVGVAQAVRDDARARGVDQHDEAVSHIRSPGLLAWKHPRTDRNPDSILLVDRNEIRRRERNPVDFGQDGGEQARTIQSPDPSVVAEIRDQKRAVGQ